MRTNLKEKKKHKTEKKNKNQTIKQKWDKHIYESIEEEEEEKKQIF